MSKAETDVIVEENISYATQDFIETLLLANGSGANLLVLKHFMLRGLVSTLVREETYYFSVPELYAILVTSPTEENTDQKPQVIS
jgi:hypothetical protein